jgi:hypothetical protein
MAWRKRLDLGSRVKEVGAWLSHSFVNRLISFLDQIVYCSRLHSTQFKSGRLFLSLASMWGTGTGLLGTYESFGATDSLNLPCTRNLRRIAEEEDVYESDSIDLPFTRNLWSRGKLGGKKQRQQWRAGRRPTTRAAPKDAIFENAKTTRKLVLLQSCRSISSTEQSISSS